jgi:AcrR family transcriptional regulator
MTESAKERPGYGKGREALLEAAIRVVGRSGLRNLTYREVAKEAGVTHGLVAHHFGSRDALLAEALDLALERSLDTAPMNPPSGKISDLGTALSAMAEADPDLQAFQYELMLESRRRPEIRPVLAKVYEHYRQAARDGLARMGIDDPVMGDLVFATLDGLVFQQVTLGNREHTDAVTSRLRGLLSSI